VIGGVALGAQAPLSFGGVLLLAALMILELSRAIGWLNRARD
jgi:hypothetical protein